MPAEWNILEQPSWVVAPRLLGSYFVRDFGGQQLIGKIVETEAYDQTDAASHSFHGKTNRTAVMFGEAGHLYVYFTYGMHYCCNVVTGTEGHGSAVLIRAIEPIKGEAFMSANRHGMVGKNIANGPAKACQAFGIDKALNGHDLRLPPLKLVLKPPIDPARVVQSTRIGISKAKDVLWRFYDNASPIFS